MGAALAGDGLQSSPPLANLQQEIYFQKGVVIASPLPDLRVKRRRNTKALKGLGTPPCEQAE
jgi:hypothetical protein